MTPTARPLEISIEATSAPVRITAPAASAERASAWLIAPMPPITCPQAPGTPSSSPSAWWRRLYAVPGLRGPAQTPTTPVEAIEPLRPSSSKCSSSRSPTERVKTRISSAISRRPSPAIRPASRSSEARSPGLFEPSAGGSRSIIGRTKSAALNSSASKPSYAAASVADWVAIDSAVRFASSKKKIGPSGVSAA